MTKSQPHFGVSSPRLELSPASIAKREFSEWPGFQAETLEVTHREPFEYRYCGDRHLLILAEQAHRDDGETMLEGLPNSTRREFSGKLTFIPAGHRFHGWQKPRLLTRCLYVYIEPRSALLPAEIRFHEIEFRPRLFFASEELRQSALKLKAQIHNPSVPAYTNALATVLALELADMNESAEGAELSRKGGLASWQQRRVAEYIEAHLAEEIPIFDLAAQTKLSPYHFARAFRQSFGVPPHRYHMLARIERAKSLLSDPQISVTEIGLKLGFSETSSFSAAFRRLARQTPSAFRRSRE